MQRMVIETSFPSPQAYLRVMCFLSLLLSSISRKDVCRKCRVLSEPRDLFPDRALLLKCPAAVDHVLWYLCLLWRYLHASPPCFWAALICVAFTTKARCFCLLPFFSSLAKRADRTTFREKTQMCTETSRLVDEWDGLGGNWRKVENGLFAPSKGDSQAFVWVICWNEGKVRILDHLTFKKKSGNLNSYVRSPDFQMLATLSNLLNMPVSQIKHICRPNSVCEPPFCDLSPLGILLAQRAVAFLDVKSAQKHPKFLLPFLVLSGPWVCVSSEPLWQPPSTLGICICDLIWK